MTKPEDLEYTSDDIRAQIAELKMARKVRRSQAGRIVDYVSNKVALLSAGIEKTLLEIEGVHNVD